MNKIILISMVLSMCFATACTTDDDISQATQNTLTMKLQGGLTTFDDGSTTRASQWTWDDGAVMYLQLYNGYTRLPATAIYSKGTDTWSIAMMQTSQLAVTGKCEAYYFDEATENQSTVTLGPTVGVYGDDAGNYAYDGTTITISLSLKPLTSRLLFVCPENTSVGGISVQGMTTYATYDAPNNRFTTSDAVISLELDEDNRAYNYMYGVFTDQSVRSLTVTNSIDGDNVQFTRTFASNVLQVGKSGRLTIPCSKGYNSWNMTPLSFTLTGYGKTATFKMIRVEAGTFQMGATSEQGSDAYGDEKPAHSVTLTKDYYIGETEVTQALWYAVMGQKPTSDGSQWISTCGLGDSRPAYYVSWNDICGYDGTGTSTTCFLYKLNKLLSDQGLLPAGKKFRLPTEAEWEFAARGGNKSKGYKYAGGDDLRDVGWYWDNIPSHGTQDVASKQANELGLYDISGNVWEWCSDWYNGSYYANSPSTDPTGPTTGPYRVVRGGGWTYGARHCRVSCRYDSPTYRDDFTDLGLRLALQ